MKKLLLFVFLLGILPAHGQNYYLGPWAWSLDVLDSEAQGVWTSPPGSQSLIDLRTLPEQGKPGPVAEGVGLFRTALVLPPPYTLVGQGADPSQVAITNGVRNAWQRATGYSPSGTTLTEILWDQLTNGADPTGMTGPKPLMPKFDTTVRELRLELHIGSLTRSERFDLATSPLRTKVEAVLQATYRDTVEDVAALRAQPDLPGKVLDFWAEKYRLDKSDKTQWERLVPQEMRDTAVLVPHQTTITESWDCADSGDISCDLTWTEIVPTHSLVGMEVLNTNSGGAGVARSARAEVDLSSVDHYAQVEITAGNDASIQYAGPVARLSSSENTGYLGSQRGLLEGVSFQARKVVSGTVTDLGTGTDQDFTGVKKISANGSTLALSHGGSEVESFTDTAITTGTRTGIFYERSNGLWTLDNFEAVDLGGAAPRRVIVIP